MPQLIELDLTDDDQRGLRSNNLVFRLVLLRLQLLAELDVIAEVVLIFQCESAWLVLQQRRLFKCVDLEDTVVEHSLSEHNLRLGEEAVSVDIL